MEIDYIDVLQCQEFDYNTPVEQIMRALHDVVQKGWVRYIGMTSCWAYQLWKCRVSPLIYRKGSSHAILQRMLSTMDSPPSFLCKMIIMLYIEKKKEKWSQLLASLASECTTSCAASEPERSRLIRYNRIPRTALASGCRASLSAHVVLQSLTPIYTVLGRALSKTTKKITAGGHSEPLSSSTAGTELEPMQEIRERIEIVAKCSGSDRIRVVDITFFRNGSCY